ncbi:hypothetical protein [Shewanella algae]|uniref:hypothetical protein n=1 Tax=Shewanella algae TaxID=38313 RepID=UPI001AAF3EAB|nr:hypothetical protein [Shewanella algae]MBO2660794.1 hypothetical protein [Shewanella algae]MCL1055319.1 hypothetical protein [Shewanella algae]
MAFRINGVLPIESSDLRFVESCLRLLSAKNFEVPISVNTATEGAQKINQALADWQESTAKKDDFVGWLQKEAKEILLPLHELDWIKGHDRTCYWAWLQVSRFQFFASPSHPVTPPMNSQVVLAFKYDQLGLKHMPSNTKERFDELVKFLDRVNQPLEWQRTLIADMKSQWEKIFTARKPLPWLQKGDEEQCRWAWEFLKKASIQVNRPTVSDISPVGVSELYHAIYAALDGWPAFADSKRLFLSDFNKAWQQKKHRDNREGKKVCNFVLRNEVKQKLDEMAAKRGVTLNHFVESLIETEFNKVVPFKK